MTAAKLQQLNQILLVKVQKIQEERDQDVRDLQERINYLEKREAKLMAEVEWREQVLQKVKGGEGVATLMVENKRLKDMVDELEKLLATQELHFEEREKVLLAERTLRPEVAHIEEYKPTQAKRKLARSRSKQTSSTPSLDSLPHPIDTSLDDLPQTPTTPRTLTTPPLTPLGATPPVPSMVVEAVVEESFKLKWCPEEYISVKMVRGDTAHSSTGEIYFSCSRSPFIHSYHPDSGEWTRLQPPCPHLFFGMTLVQGRVTAVGGQKGPLITAALMTLMEGGGEGGEGEGGRRRNSWQEGYPPMPTKRFNLTAVSICEGTHEERLLAIGGLSQNGTSLDCVEMLSLETMQWSAVASLPRPADMLCSAIADNQLYLLGASNTKRVYTCYIPYLMQTTPTQTLEVWFQLPATPTTSPTGIVLGNQLLIVGGFDEKGTDSTEVFHFQQHNRTWKVISHMSTACNKPLLAHLPDNKLMVVGGSTKVNHMMNVVQTADITLSNTNQQ